MKKILNLILFIVVTTFSFCDWSGNVNIINTRDNDNNYLEVYKNGNSKNDSITVKIPKIYAINSPCDESNGSVIIDGNYDIRVFGKVKYSKSQTIIKISNDGNIENFDRIISLLKKGSKVKFVFDGDVKHQVEYSLIGFKEKYENVFRE